MKKEVFENAPFDAYTKATLDCGLQVYVMEKAGYNSNYAIFGTRYGSIDLIFETEGNTYELPAGIAHYLEHKLFESEDGDAFTKYAETGASANAFTSFDRTCYLFSCSDKFEKNFDILLDLVSTPYFTEETVKKEQGIIGQEIKMYDDSPAWKVMFNMLEGMYFNHTVKIDIAGTVETIKKINYALLYKCYELFYNPSNMFICVVGNVNTENILKTVEKKINPLPAKEVTVKDSPEPEGVKTPYVEGKLPVSMPQFCLGFKEKITSPYKSLKSKICISLLLEMIAGDASPLYARLMREGLINDDFAFEYFTGRNYAAILFEGESKSPETVEKLIKEEIERLKTDGIDKKLFSAVKCGLYGDVIRRQDSVEGICMQLVECAMFGDNYYDEIKLLKSITADDVFRKLDIFKNENSVLSVIKPSEVR